MPSIYGVGYICKRLLDLTIAVTAFILLSPVMILTAFIVRIKLGSPVIFKQNRPGMNGEIFTLYKFKTLLDSCGKDGKLLPDSERLTPFGDFMRSFSLDELPQFWNVIKGDMSAIGPRPQMEKYWELLSDEQKNVFNIKPGITGWAQINGRNLLTWEQRFELDAWYLENWSIWLDIKIAFITIWKVIIREGVRHPGHATMVEFKGTRKDEALVDRWQFEAVSSIDSISGVDAAQSPDVNQSSPKVISDYN